MAAEKKIFVNRIREGQVVEDVFMIRNANRAETRSGKPYLILTLMDRSGEIGARVWDNVDAFMEICQPGGLVLVTAQAQAYMGALQLKVDAMQKIDEKEIDRTLFMQTTRKNIDGMGREIDLLAESIRNRFYKKLLQAFFSDRDFFKQFKTAPAAKSLHHAYLGGLLEHTLAVARLAEMLSGIYPALDRDLLLAGALLHDIGKTKEFTFDAYPFDYTDQGRLMGHLVLGVEMIQARINGISGFPEDLATRLQHLVLSHHGRYEYGSPALPMMSEAFVLHFLDDLDAKLNFIGHLEEQAPESGYQWTDFQRVLERFLYVNGRPNSETTPAGAADLENSGNRSALNSKQQQLF